MSKKTTLLFYAVILISIFVIQAKAQTRKSVDATEVNGTFRSYFSGKYKGSYDEIKVLAVGKGKLKISFNLIYPYIDGTGELSANMGEADGTAQIEGDTATYTDNEFGQCSISIKFIKAGQIKVTQNGNDSNCGFGHNVTADGTYKKVSGAKPKFDEQ